MLGSRDTTPPPGRHPPRQTHTPLGRHPLSRHPLRQIPPTRQIAPPHPCETAPLQQTVRILLECILVYLWVYRKNNFLAISLRKLCFYTCLSVILFAGGCVPQCMLGYTPPGADPPSTHYTVHTRRSGQQARGTHPTGMHTCFTIEINFLWLMHRG